MVEKSSIDGAVAADVVVARMKVLLEEASEGIAAGDLHSTFGCFAATAKLARHTFCAGRVRMAMQPMLESLIAECGKSEDTVASFARRP